MLLILAPHFRVSGKDFQRVSWSSLLAGEQNGTISPHFQSANGPGARSERVDFQAEPLQHRHVDIAQRRIVALIERQVLPVFEAAAGQQDRQVSGVVAAGVAQVAAEQHHRAVEQGFVLFLASP